LKMIAASVSRQHIILFLVFVIAVLFSFCWYQVDIASFRYKSECPEETRKQDSEVWNRTLGTETTPKDTLGLVWNWPWGQQFALDKCTQYGFHGCKLSTDRSLYSTADAVFIHHADIMYNKKALPQQPRPFFQRWVWVNLEPPLIIRNLEMVDNLFNATMTFRQDSDIFIPYGRMQITKDPQKVIVPKKSKLVSWVVSKWYPGVPRIAYYEQLKKHIPIDVYGANHMPLSSQDFHPTISQYKFYLSFENSIYKDYITEKIWSNAFGSWAVPVVLGTSRKNYERFVPGDAFIHVDDFPSAKELANYLLELDKDDVKYQKYFNWRSQYYVKIDDGWSYFYCKACSFIKQSPRYQVVHNIADWFLKDV
ncbi:PREDICTED: galactoside 3(4)-L-fucosyltransferase-like, partial [Nanorana parkeri]|uniref:galactoside 3(4)-L-fucosyltransferase-like n=1 Tax=Nanorana parkeri TaxID=125878 RepID=UPI000854B505